MYKIELDKKELDEIKSINKFVSKEKDRKSINFLCYDADTSSLKASDGKRLIVVKANLGLRLPGIELKGFYRVELLQSGVGLEELGRYYPKFDHIIPGAELLVRRWTFNNSNTKSRDYDLNILLNSSYHMLNYKYVLDLPKCNSKIPWDVYYAKAKFFKTSEMIVFKCELNLGMATAVLMPIIAKDKKAKIVIEGPEDAIDIINLSRSDVSIKDSLVNAIAQIFASEEDNDRPNAYPLGIGLGNIERQYDKLKAEQEKQTSGVLASNNQ